MAFNLFLGIPIRLHAKAVYDDFDGIYWSRDSSLTLESRVLSQADLKLPEDSRLFTGFLQGGKTYRLFDSHKFITENDFVITTPANV